ncbi:hypothetical protein [Chania multitudinisentens]
MLICLALLSLRWAAIAFG